MNAKEAREKAVAAVSGRQIQARLAAQTHITRALREIASRAEEGYFSLTLEEVPRSLQEAVQDELEDLGYEVEEGRAYETLEVEW
jgi:pyrroline-5-carboxylate reductase